MFEHIPASGAHTTAATNNMPNAARILLCLQESLNRLHPRMLSGRVAVDITQSLIRQQSNMQLSTSTSLHMQDERLQSTGSWRT